MELPKIPLFDWLLERLYNAKYDFGNSSITGVKYTELIELTGFEIPDDLNLGYNNPFGADELVEALAEIYDCDKSQVITTTGGSEANFLVFLALIERGSEVIVEQPGYSPLWSVPKMLGAKVIDWPRRFENGFELDLETLKNKITDKTNLVVITNLHNPSGVLAEPETIRAATEIAADKGAVLFIDEMFLDVSNTPHRTAFGLDSVLVTASVSKVYGIGGMRTGWIIAPDELAKQCMLAKWQATVASPYFSELLIASALTKARTKLIQRCKDIAARNFPIVKEWLEENEDIIDCVQPAGGIMCYPRYKIKSKLDSVQLCDRIFQEKGVLLSPGTYFGSDGHFRLTYMNPEDELRTGLTVIADMLKNFL